MKGGKLVGAAGLPTTTTFCCWPPSRYTQQPRVSDWSRSPEAEQNGREKEQTTSSSSAVQFPFIFFFSLGAEDGRRRDLADASASARVYETVLLGGPAIFKYLLCLRLLFLQRFKPDRPELFPLRFGTGLLAGRDPNRRWRLTAGRRRRRRSLLLLLLLLLLVVVSLRRAGLLARRPNT